MSTNSTIISQWVEYWTPRLVGRFDPQKAEEDPSYAELWVFVEATPEANADLDHRLGRT